MDIESVRNYCLSLPMTTEDSAFGDDIVLFRVLDKIFCCLPLEGDGYLAVKCEPLRAIELRERYAEIEGAAFFIACPKTLRSCQMLTSLLSALWKKVNGYSTFSNVTPKNKELQTVCPSICFNSFPKNSMQNSEVRSHIEVLMC